MADRTREQISEAWGDASDCRELSDYLWDEVLAARAERDQARAVANEIGRQLKENAALEDQVERLRAQLAAIELWAHTHGADLVPGVGQADTFGDGMRAAKAHVLRLWVGVTPRPALADGELRALMDLLMVSDPSPLTPAQDKALRDLADREARVRGFDGWYVAYHEMPRAGVP